MLFFWPTWACQDRAGPCSEIYIDRGPEYGPDGGPIVDEDRFLEIWNLVFMRKSCLRYGRRTTSTSPATYRARTASAGMGLERVAYLLQGVDNLATRSIRSTRLLTTPLSWRASATAAGTRTTYGSGGRRPHRSGLMLIADGVTPGNEARGYVLRRLLRQVVRAMRLLGVAEPVLPELLPISRDLMAESLPRSRSDWARISQIVPS